MTDRPIVVVGPGARFYSGITRYTVELADALAASGAPVTVVLARRLLPRRLYPGRDRVGRRTTADLGLRPDVTVVDTLDWWPSAGSVAALAAVWTARPAAVVLQWWSATMLHWHLAVAAITKARGGRVIVEFHETLDVAEAAIGPIRWWARTGMALLARLADAGVAHSHADTVRIPTELPIGALPLTVIHHPPYPLHRHDRTAGDPTTTDDPQPPTGTVDAGAAETAGPVDAAGWDGVRPIRVLHFGVVRHYKGVDVLADAAAELTRRGVDVHVTVAGEVWDVDAAAALDRLDPGTVTVVDRYLDDDELPALFADTDVVALPYRRSAASGPLALAVAAGRPVALTRIPALLEIADHYSGAAFCDVDDAAGLADAIVDAAGRTGRRHTHPHSWQAAAATLRTLTDPDTATRPGPAIGSDPATAGGPAAARTDATPTADTATAGRSGVAA